MNRIQNTSQIESRGFCENNLLNLTKTNTLNSNVLHEFPLFMKSHEKKSTKILLMKIYSAFLILSSVIVSLS